MGRILAVILLVLILHHGAGVSATPMRLIGVLEGSAWADRLGDACEGLGDINHDGYNDFLIASFGSRTLQLYLGGPRPFDNPPVFTRINHGTAGGLRSFSPVTVGDMDCDGTNDFVSLFGNNDTLSLIMNLDSLGALRDMKISISSIYVMANVVAGGGDNNNDDRPELWLVKDNIRDTTIWGYLGCELLDSIADFRIESSSAPDLKYRGIGGLCSTCDLNGDSIPEIIYGQYTDDPTYPGRVCIVWGGDMISTQPDLVFYAPRRELSPQVFGVDLACLGDISGDGIDDLWVSQDLRNYIYFGGQPFDAIPDVTIDWLYAYYFVESVGDINNDGWNDVALVRRDYLINRVSYIYCGPEMDTLVDVVYSDDDFYYAYPHGSVCCVGIDHSWAGDIDGDGIDDILLSARSTDVDEHDYGLFFIQAGWNGQPVDVNTDDGSNWNSIKLTLHQNRPNPFNSGTTIEFSLPISGYTELRIFNLLGELIAYPVREELIAGQHKIEWDGRDLQGRSTPTGIYFYQIRSGQYSDTKKMLLLK